MVEGFVRRVRTEVGKRTSWSVFPRLQVGVVSEDKNSGRIGGRTGLGMEGMTEFWGDRTSVFYVQCS